MKLWKRNAIAAAIVLFVCGAVYLNWSYSQDTEAGKTLGEAALVGSQSDPLVEDGSTAEKDQESKEGETASTGEGSTYFSTASTASRPGTMLYLCSRRRRRMKKPTRPLWTRPTPPSRPWPTIP